jgi:hypothetical protein
VAAEVERGHRGTSLICGSLGMRQCGLGTTISMLLSKLHRRGGAIGVMAVRLLEGREPQFLNHRGDNGGTLKN